MIGRICLWVGIVAAVAGSSALAQDDPMPMPPPPAPATPAAPAAPTGTPIPPGAQTTSNLTSAMRDQIAKYEQEQFTALTGTDGAAQAAARKALTGALPGSQSAFYGYFTEQWTSLAAAAMKQNATVNARLNIAIVTSTLTAAAQSLDAEPLVDQLLADREPAVVLWSIKAAKPLIPTILINPSGANSQLPAAIVGAVKRTGNADVIGGFIAQDAYRALAIPAVGGNVPVAVANAANQKISTLVPAVLDVLEYRIGLHAQGLVPSPGAEREIGTFLSVQYSKVPPATQLRIVQDLVTLETYVGQRVFLYQNNKSDVAAIRDLIKYTTSPLDVIDPLAQNSLSWLSNPPPSSSPADIQAHTKQLFGIISANPALKITQPPAIKEIEPPPPTTPTPATPAGTTPGTAQPR